MKYFKFEAAAYGDFVPDDDYGYVRLPYVEAGKKRVLFVLDWLPKEDLHSGKLLSGAQGDLLRTLVKHSASYSKKQFQHSWAAISYSAYRTVGTSDDYKTAATKNFDARLA